MVMIDFTKLTLGELLQLHAFVTADASKSFGTKNEAKKIVRTRLAEVEEEVYMRVYGCNPFFAKAITVTGRKPEDIDLGKFDSKEPKNFVVEK